MGKIYYCIVFVFLLCSAKVSAQTYSWSARAGAANTAGAYGFEESVRDVAVDASGNSYVIGVQNSSTDPNIFIAKYGPTGTQLWSKNLGSTQEDRGFAIAATPAGDIYVTGTVTGNNIYFELVTAGRLSTASNGTDVFVVKFNTTGNVQWVRGVGGTSSADLAADIALDGSGNAWVAASIATNGANIDFYAQGASSRIPLSSFGSSQNAGLQACLFKVASDGSFSPSDFYLFGGGGADQSRSLTIDASNNMYLSGEFFGTVDFDPGAGTTNLVESSPQGTGDAYIAKYSSSMALQWAGTIKGSAAEFVNGLDVDASGNLYAVGSFNSFSNFDLFAGTQNLTPQGTADIFIAKYSGSDGSFNYARRIGGTSGINRASGINVTSTGDQYITGTFSGPTANFNPGGTAVNMTPTGTTDAFLAKYTSAGINTWAFKAGGAGLNGGYASNIASDGKIVWGGYFSGSSVDFDPGAGTNTLTSAGNEDIFVASYTECAGAAITAQPAASQSICTGQNATFSVTATGTGLTYLWKKGGVALTDGGSISGSTTATLTITGLVSGDAGTYTVDVIGCMGTVTSSNAVLTVPSGAAITTQPVASQTLCAGAAASMSVTATGTGLTYQWKKGGVSLTNGGTISGATSASLNISSLVAGDAGNYTVDVTASGCGSPLTSSTSVLTVNAAAAITVQPTSSQTLCVGAAATVSVTATGAGLTYQWKKGGVNVTDGGTISGATTATLNISSVVSGDAGTYTVVITGSCGSPVTSSNSVLTVNSGAAISAQPAATQTLCTGNAAAFSVTASGTGLTYQWQKGGVNIINGGTISGALTSSLSISSLVSGDAGTYTVIVTASCGSPVTSSNSVLTVNTGAAITGQPIATQTLCAGAAASMSVTATGTSLTYQWKKGGVNVTNGGTITGATTATLNISSLAAGDAGNYTVDVTASGCGSAVTSSVSALVVNAAPSITSQPAATQTLCTGNAASFSVTATGAGLTYQWQKGGVNLTDGGTISGATSATLSISSLVSGDAGTYTVIVSGTCGSPVTSSNSVLTVNSGAAITVQPVASQALCVGAAASMSVTATGSGLTYQWKKGGVNVTNGGTVSGATTATLNISALAAGDAGSYTVDVTASGCGSAVTSTASVLTVNAAASITTQPVATQTFCTGSAASFTVTAAGAGLTYQWKKGGVNVTNGGTVSGATSSTLSISSLVSGDAGNYTVTVTGTCGAPVTSSASALTVNSSASISSQPIAVQTLCVGDLAVFSVTASGTSLSYQWQKNGVNVTNGGGTAGATTATLSIASVIASNAGDYTVNVTAAGCGSAVTSSISQLIVNSPISITTQPVASQTLCTGNSATFSATVTGSNLTFQWQKNGSNISDGGTVSGAATSTLTISSLVAGDAGNYTLHITGVCGPAVTSSTSALTVNTGPSITTQPVASQTLCTGNAASFSVAATGSGLTYQWQKGGVNLTNGGTISGATTANLNISSLVAGDAGNYTVNVSASGCGAPLVSSTSVLTVNNSITITTQPVASQTLCTGNAASFSIVASGTGITYQWQKGGVNLTDGGTISGATTANLNISSLVSGDAGTYTVNMTGACAPLTSSNSVLTVNSNASITTQPVAAQTLCTGNAASFSVSATGTGVTYQWQKGGVNLTDGGTISGATTANLNISSLVAGDAGNYTVNVSASSCGAPVVSSTSVLTVNNSITITTQPVASQTLCTGNAASFSITASGTGIAYQWQKDGVNLTDGGTISGATTANLNISSLVAGDAGTYTVDLTGACAPLTSANAVLNVNMGASITTQPVAAQTLCTGNAASFSVAATGTGVTYQWQKGGVNLTDGGTISGATTANLNISSLVAGDAGNYTVNVSASGCGAPVVSSTSVLTVNNSITITTQPVASQSLCTGNAASFSIAASGTGITYQWQKDGVNLTDGGTISGATTANLNISSLVAGDAGTYTVDLTGACAPLTSANSVLTVNTNASIITQPVASQTLCTGAAASFSVTATGTALTYQWQLGGVNLTDGGTISGATTANLAISSVTTGDAGNYTVNVSAAGCGSPVTSSISALAVNTPVNITTQPVASQTLCTGNAASFSVAATGSGLTYQWQLGGVDVVDGGTISGATTANLSISSLASGDAGTYTVNITGTCGPMVTSSSSSLTVNVGPAITTQPVASQTVCAGSAASFNVVATGSGLTYQWQLGGVNVTDGGTISGATTSTLNISSAATADAGNYTVDISAVGCGTPLTSSVSTLIVNTPVNITTQPVASQTLCTGNAASFSVAATGTGLTYQWQLGGVDLADGGTISGATTANLSISSLVSGDAGTYTVNITGTCGPMVTSSSSVLNVNIGASITSQPVASQTVCTGNPAAFSVSATGTGLTYQWKLGGVSLVNGGTVSGATSANLNISSVAAGDAGNYTVDVSASGCGTPLTSTTSLLTVNNSVVINTQPVANQALCAGSAATMQVLAAGTGLTYQWQKNGVNVIDGGTISGATTATLNISSVVTGDAGNYTVVLTGTCNTVTSATSVLSVTASASITMQPTDVNACLGQAANFDLTATGPGLTYQWKKNGVNMVDGGSISGSTTSSLVFSPVAAADADTYVCVISSSCGAPVTSNTVTLTVGTGATITKQPISSVICLNQAASFTIQATGATSYQWQFKPAGGSYANLANGANISGVTTTTLIVNSAQFTDRGNYRCLVMGGSCSGGVFTAAASLSFQSPSIASQPLSQSVCAGQMITFGLVALGNNLTYQWVKDGVNMVNGGRISGAQSSTLKIVNADATDEATYYCEVRGLCPPPTYSDDVTLTLTACTGVEDAIDGTLFNIYPNPSTGIYHLDMDMYAAGTLTYEIFNTLGENITGGEVHGEGKVVSVIDLSTQVPGVYIIKLEYDDRHSWVRVVLEK